MSLQKVNRGTVITAQDLNSIIEKIEENVFIDRTVTIGTTWTGSSAPYTQEIAVTGIYANDGPIVDLILSDDYETSQTQIEEWAKIYRITTSNDAITVYANEPTLISLTVQLLVSRDNVIDVDVIDGNQLVDNSVTRAKLAQDALYSPTLLLSTTSITTDHIGKTIYNPWDESATYTLTQANSTNMPCGTEIAFVRSGTSAIDVKIVGSDVVFAITGETDFKISATVKITEPFGMIALKKMADADNTILGDVWLVTGNVEVVS